MKFNHSISHLLGMGVLLFIFFLFQPLTTPAQSLEKQIDELMSAAYKPDEPGAVVRVQKDGKVLFEKAYGMANLELGVKMQPDHVLRLGSITKQFTAVAILMLVQEGKISLDDDFTKYLPDYPGGGRKITVAQLLDHTSGIKSYTDMEAWLPLWRKDFTVAELIDLFKNEPFDFEPGEQYRYNNSAYILAGAIIEKVSGMTYTEFLQKRIFEPLGMKDTYYDVTEQVVPRRVPGYQKSGEGYQNAPYLSMTQPYAAGSLMSTVADLGKWDEALYTEKLLKKALLEKAWTPRSLNDATPVHYGFGWASTNYEGHKLIYHDGGIHGFLTSGIRVPDQHLYIVLLSNNSSVAPSDMTYNITTTILGKQLKEPTAIKVPASELNAYVGMYEIGKDHYRMITLEGNQLYSQRTGSTKFELHPYEKDKFYFKDSDIRLTFKRDGSGKITGVGASEKLPYGTDQFAKRTDLPFPEARKEVAVDAATFDKYVGDYELFPGFILTVFRKDDRFFSQATNQPEFEIFPESKTRFFLKVVDAQLEFVEGADGKVNELVLYQGGQEIKGKRK